MTRRSSVRLGRPPSHGMHGSRTYHAWLSLKAACDNPRNHRYRSTGARGITYPDEWSTFEGFLEDMGEAPAGARLKRLETNKGYEKRNCHWVK